MAEKEGVSDLMKIRGIEYPIDHVNGSPNGWPAPEDAPEASPYNKYVCLRCRWERSYKANGEFFMTEDAHRLWREAEEDILFHVERCQPVYGQSHALLGEAG